MSLTLPEAVRPVWDFVVHVAIGAIAFVAVLLIAVAIAGVVKGIEGLGFAPLWLMDAAHWVEWAIFWLDLFLFGLFFLAEALKLTRRLVKEMRD